MKKVLIEVWCWLGMMSVISPCWANACVQMKMSVLKVLLYILFFFFFFLLTREHTDYEISLYVLEKKVWKLIVGKNEWLIMLTVSFYFMHSRQRFFLYTCSNNPHEVSIEFLWLYVINVYIFVKHVSYFCLLTSCFSLLRVCECHIMYAYFAVS